MMKGSICSRSAYAVTLFAMMLLTMRPSASTAQTPAAAAAADMQIRAAAVTFSVGLTGRYSVSITNQGPKTTSVPIVFRTELPDGLSFSSISGGWTCDTDGQLVTCSNPTPMPAQSGTSFVFIVNVGPAAVPRVFTQLNVDYPGDPDTSDNSVLKVTSAKPARRPRRGGTATATIPAGPTRTPTRTLPPTQTATPSLTRTATQTPTPVPNTTDLGLRKSTFGTFNVGRNGTYTLTVTNLGTLPTNSTLTVVDDLPNGLGFVSATGTDWTCAAAGQKVTCTRTAALAGLSTSNLTLVVSVGLAASPTVTNVASLAYLGDPDLTNNLARKPTTVRR